MLHIIILNKGYFPEKLSSKDSSKDKVIVIAMANDSIPVSAYQGDMLRNMEVKLIPDIKGTASLEEKNILRIAQAMLIGQITATENEYEIYSDDTDLIKALSPFTGVKPQPKKVAKKPVEKKEMVKEEPEKGRNSSKKEKAPKNTDKKSPAKIPSLAQVKKVLGAANSAYAKLIYDTIKKSNQITFEMNVRMELAKAGLDAGACQELAKTLNDEFGKALPIS